MNKEKFKSRPLEFKYTVECGWREIYEFCNEQREAAFAFAEMALANKRPTEAEIERGEKPKVTITVEEV